MKSQSYVNAKSFFILFFLILLSYVSSYMDMQRVKVLLIS